MGDEGTLYREENIFEGDTRAAYFDDDEIRKFDERVFTYTTRYKWI